MSLCGRPVTHTAQRILAEGLGTFILCFSIILSTQNACELGDQKCEAAGNAPPTFQAVGYCLAALIYGLDHIASHFNPAVTLGAYLQGAVTLPLALSFVASQLVGGTLGGVLGNALRATPVPSFNPNPSDWGKAFAVEAMYTGALVLVMQATGLFKNAKEPNSFFGLSVGFTVAAGAATVSRISGGCFNPAVGMAIDFATLSSDPTTFQDIWLYFIAPFTGAIIASIFSLAMHSIEHGKWAVPGWFCRCRCLCCRPSAEEEEEEEAAAAPGQPEGDDGRMPLILPIAEFVGTFFLVLTATLQSYGPSKALAVGMMLTAMVYALDHVCGADLCVPPRARSALRALLCCRAARAHTHSRTRTRPRCSPLQQPRSDAGRGHPHGQAVQGQGAHPHRLPGAVWRRLCSRHRHLPAQWRPRRQRRAVPSPQWQRGRRGRSLL